MVVSPPPTSSFHSFSGFPLPGLPSVGGNFILYFSSFSFVDIKHYSVAVNRDLNAILSVNHHAELDWSLGLHPPRPLPVWAGPCRGPLSLALV